MSGNGITWAICKSAPRSRQITTPAPHHSASEVRGTITVNREVMNCSSLQVVEPAGEVDGVAGEIEKERDLVRRPAHDEPAAYHQRCDSGVTSGSIQRQTPLDGRLNTTRGPIYKISYDLSYDYRKFIVRSTYDSDLKRAEISLRNIVS